MSKFTKSTEYETEIIKSRMEEFLPALVHLPPVALQRYRIISRPGDSVLVECETNDDDDDGYPDGAWSTWTETFGSVERALEVKGKCRVGISGVIVTVTVDGKEVR